MGVVTTSPERGRAFADQFPGRATFASLEALAAAGTEAVTISTPAATHIELAQRALHLGLAVISDKPFALDADSARETVCLAEALDHPLSVYQNRRWDSDFRTVRKALDDGLWAVRSDSSLDLSGSAWTAGPGAAGGGTLLDFGSHLVDQALVLFGDVRTVYAEIHAPDGSARSTTTCFSRSPMRAASTRICGAAGASTLRARVSV